MHELIQEFVNKDVWAIVGYSSNPRKYGHIIFQDLKRAGYRLYAVNLKGGDQGSVRTYRSVSDLPRDVEVVNFVIPSQAGEQVARECAEAGLERVWLQPGAESDELIELCDRLGLRVVHHRCAMVEKRRRNA